MKSGKRYRHNISTAAALLTFAVFAICVVSVLLYGAKAYKNLTDTDSSNYSYRTCSQFINTKLRRSVAGANVSVEQFGDGDCIVLHETIEGREYITRLYCYDGWLCEMFVSKLADSTGFLPGDGEKVLEAESLTAGIDGGLLNVSVKDSEDHNIDIVYALRGQEAAYEKK